jgi:FG-GAP repeat
LHAPAWVAVVMVVGVALVAVPAALPVEAQPVTVPGPDFDNDGFGDLAVGIPGEGVGGAAGAGAVAVLYGSGDGLASDGRVVSQGVGGVPGALEGGDRFGAALSGPFLHESDVLEDLGVGAPGERIGGAAGAGAVSVLFSTGPDGLGGAGKQFLYQGTGHLAGAAEPSDGFAGALATTAG